MPDTRITLRPTLEGVHAAASRRGALAVRTQDGSIAVRLMHPEKEHPLSRIPVLRGVRRLFDSLAETAQLCAAARTLRPQELTRPTRGERALAQALHISPLTLTGLGTGLGILLIALAFAAIPLLAEQLLAPLGFGLCAALVCILRCILLLAAVAGCFRLKFLRRLAMYRGAANKTADCLASGRSLDIENVLTSRRLAAASDPAFLLLTAIAFIVLGTILPLDFDNLILRVLVRIALIPVTAGVLNEFVRPVERHPDNPLHAPLDLLQRPFTLEPHSEMLEVAITAVRAVKGELKRSETKTEAKA